MFEKKRFTQYIILFVTFLLTLHTVVADEAFNLSLSSRPYHRSNLYTNPLLPNEDEAVAVTVEIPKVQIQGVSSEIVEAELVIEDLSGNMLHQEIGTLEPRGSVLAFSIEWVPIDDGLYKVRAYLDPLKKLDESNRLDNFCEITVPVLAAGKSLDFVWYALWYEKYVDDIRWATCITATRQEQYLFDRGILPLAWRYGGGAWKEYDKELAKSDPEKVLEQTESHFYDEYSSEKIIYGVGIDECKGYPGTFDLARSIASMKAMVRAKKENPERIFAVWNAGKINPALAEWYRKGADFLLLETYIWSYIPEDLGTQEIYQIIRDRMDPLVRGYDMLVPAYGNWCRTLIGLDTGSPWNIDVGEQEEVVRFIRRTYPEMAGLAWFNGSYEGNTEDHHRKYRQVLRNADDLCFKYFIKPCLTLNRNGLWLTPVGPAARNDVYELTASISNIGGMDSGRISVEFYMDDALLGVRFVQSVPAGTNRLENTVTMSVPVTISAGPGNHTFEARIIEAPGSTVLDSIITTNRFVQ
jgi:hypothetical protein